MPFFALITRLIEPLHFVDLSVRFASMWVHNKLHFHQRTMSSARRLSFLAGRWLIERYCVSLWLFLAARRLSALFPSFFSSILRYMNTHAPMYIHKHSLWTDCLSLTCHAIVYSDTSKSHLPSWALTWRNGHRITSAILSSHMTKWSQDHIRHLGTRTCSLSLSLSLCLWHTHTRHMCNARDAFVCCLVSVAVVRAN